MIKTWNEATARVRQSPSREKCSTMIKEIIQIDHTEKKVCVFNCPFTKYT
jgi:hypothetical protein